jgi:hypothetical protein
VGFNTCPQDAVSLSPGSQIASKLLKTAASSARTRLRRSVVLASSRPANPKTTASTVSEFLINSIRCSAVGPYEPDIQVRKAEFNTVLVYDISRWTRFQDADESAYYEYICKRAGIAVEYCAEQFDNDGSPVSTIVKGVKRAEDVNVRTVLRKAYERKLLRGGRLLAAKRLVEARLKHGKGQATSIGRSKKNLSLETLMKTYQDDVACADSWRPRRAPCQRSQRQHQDITRKAASPGWHLR